MRGLRRYSPKAFVYAFTNRPNIINIILCVFELNDAFLRSIIQPFHFFDMLRCNSRLGDIHPIVLVLYLNIVVYKMRWLNTRLCYHWVAGWVVITEVPLVPMCQCPTRYLQVRQLCREKMLNTVHLHMASQE